MTKYNFSYEENRDDLFLYHPKNKSEGSVELGEGNIILDFNKEGKPVGLQILNASTLFKELLEMKETEARAILSNLTQTQVDFKKWKNQTYLLIFRFKWMIEGEEKELSSTLLSAEPHLESPAIATA